MLKGLCAPRCAGLLWGRFVLSSGLSPGQVIHGRAWGGQLPCQGLGSAAPSAAAGAVLCFGSLLCHHQSLLPGPGEEDGWCAVTSFPWVFPVGDGGELQQGLGSVYWENLDSLTLLFLCFSTSGWYIGSYRDFAKQPCIFYSIIPQTWPLGNHYCAVSQDRAQREVPCIFGALQLRSSKPDPPCSCKTLLL